MYGGPYMTYTWIMYSSATSACMATYMTYTCPIWRVMYNHVNTQALQLPALIVPLRTYYYHCTKGASTYIYHGMSAPTTCDARQIRIWLRLRFTSTTTQALPHARYVLSHTLECQPGGPGLSAKADRCRQLARTVPVTVIAPSLLVLRCHSEISRQLDDYIADLQRAQKRR